MSSDNSPLTRMEGDYESTGMSPVTPQWYLNDAELDAVKNSEASELLQKGNNSALVSVDIMLK